MKPHLKDLDDLMEAALARLLQRPKGPAPALNMQLWDQIPLVVMEERAGADPVDLLGNSSLGFAAPHNSSSGGRKYMLAVKLVRGSTGLHRGGLAKAPGGAP